MQIFIPVRLVSKQENQDKFRKFCQIHPERQNQECNSKEHDHNYFKDNKQKQLRQSKMGREINQKLQEEQVSNTDLQNIKNQVSKKLSNRSHHDMQFKSEQQLDKKSTKQSFHEVHRSQQEERSDEQQVSSGNFIISKNQIKQANHFQQYMQTESDIYPSSIYSCKICLQQSNDSSYDPINNPISKVCNCQDHVHLICLEEWITRRDILNSQIQPNQCEVCLAFYSIEIQLQEFLNCRIFIKNLSKKPYRILCRLLPPLVFFLLSIFVLYVLIALSSSLSEDGGFIKEIFKMPYGTCITVSIFLFTIVSLLFGIFLYNWITEFFIDYRYRIHKIDDQKIQGNHL